MKAKTLKLNVASASYPILIGKGVVKEIEDYLPDNASKIFIICDRKLMSIRQKVLNSLKNIEIPVHEIPVSAGEDLKSIESIYPLYGKLLDLKGDRNSVIIALGGGSVGDAAGFIAATFMRGISWIGVPTTLLAQVDSSVGGKTGINHESGKNLIGAFHQPCVVACDTDFLLPLGEREMVSGVGEIVKYALAFDKEFFLWLEKNINKVLKKYPRPLAYAIEKSLQWKCMVVSKDEFDREGVREVLNFGHTFGHALESYTKYSKYQHGEAVIWGMRFALALSLQRDKIDEDKVERMDDLLARLPVPSLPKNLEEKEILSLMKKDKKAEGQTVRFVLLRNIGRSVSDKKVGQDDLLQAFAKLKELNKRKSK